MIAEEPKFNNINSFLENFTDGSLLEHRSCPICGSENYKPIVKYEDFQFFSDSSDLPNRCEIQTVLCHDCNCVYQNPIYTDYGFNILYKKAGMSYGAPSVSLKNMASWLMERGYVKPDACLLDIGCGVGSFISLFTDSIRKIGIDIDKPSIEKARESFPHIRFLNNSFESIKLDETPDVITMMHVLEHLRNPLATLRSLWEISSNDTLLVVEVPTIDGHTGGDITGFFSQLHLQHFLRSVLHAIMERAGWQIMESSPIKDYNGYVVVAKKAPPTLKISVTPFGNDALNHCLALDEKARNSVENRINSFLLSNQPGVKIVIWGAGLHTETLYHKTSLFDPKRKLEYLLVDIDPAKQGKSWRGIECHSPEILPKIKDKFKIIISSYGSTPSILKMIDALFPTSPDILQLYDTVRVRY